MNYPTSPEEFEELRRQKAMAEAMRNPRGGGGGVPPGAGQVASQFMGGGEAAAGGGEAAGGGFMSTYAAPAAAMAALVYGGEKADIGGGKQMKEYKRIGRQIDDELFDKLKFWDWL